MSATTFIFNKPIFHNKKLHTFTNYSKPVSRLRYRDSNSVLSSGYGVRGIKKTLGRKSMSEFITASTYRNNGNGNGDEKIHVLQMDDESNEFRPELLSTRIESTLSSLSKWLVAALFGAVILLRHDADAMWAATGSVINAMLSVLLKRLLNQERPVSTRRSDPGMPSSHAQSISYIVMFWVFSTVEWLGIDELSLTLSGLSVAFGSYLSWLRVSQKLHTASQVAVGAAVGTTFCVLWYVTWKTIVQEVFASSPWVQIVVVSGAAGFGVGFVLYVIQNWFRDEQDR